MLYEDSEGYHWILHTDFGNGTAKMMAADKNGISLGRTLFFKKITLMEKVG
jgi:hypothetical protein